MSKVVFVGNVPYNMSEDALIDVFKSVGNVVGFRLVFDRDTGKPRGYGFCEFTDHETALSAVRNLNGTDCGGRPLRIDLADSDPMLEGKTTVRGEIIDSGDHHRHWGQGGGRDNKRPDSAFLASLPPGRQLQPGQSATDAITQLLATVPQQQMIEVLAQMKAFMINHPEHAKILLNGHPQLAYALFQALLMHNIVEPTVLQRLLPSAPAAPIAASPIQPVYGQTPGIPPVPSYPAAQALQSMMPLAPSSMSMPGFGGYVPPPPVPAVPTQPPTINPYYRPPTAPQVPQPSTPVQSAPPAVPPPATVPTANYNVNPDQQQMLMQVLSLTQDQIAAMPPTEQETIRMLRAQLGVAT